MSNVLQHPNRTVAWLALRDFGFETRISVCFVFALTAILAPLLVLFGLKFGLIDTLTDRLKADPKSREIIGVGSGQFSTAWFESLRERPDVAFVIPFTRSLSANLNVVTDRSTGNRFRGLKIVPTRQNDPLTHSTSVLLKSTKDIVLSEEVAQKLGAVAGSVLRARIQRRLAENFEHVFVDLTVVAIIPRENFSEEAAFVTLELLVATEDYRDGYGVSELQWQGKKRPQDAPRIFPRYRLYADSIYDVSSLRSHLVSQSLEVRTRAEQIETLQALDSNLDKVFWLIAGIGSLGFIASLAANLVANVDRKVRELSVLRLLGLSGRHVALFPSTQAMVIALSGTLLAFLVFFGVGAFLNNLFSDSLRPGEVVCTLETAHLVAAVLITLVSATAASSWASLRAIRIEPTTGLRGD